MTKYKKDTIIKCYVTGIENYGIFTCVNQDYNGLIHISEISDGFVKDVNDYVEVGETIYAKILDINEEELQLKLSIKNIDYKIKKKPKKVSESPSGFNPLKEQLNIWIEEKLKDIKEKVV